MAFEDRQLLKDPGYKSPFLAKKLLKFGDYFSGCSRVLEIGCGWGEFQQLLKERGIKSEAVELNPERAKYVRGQGHKVHSTSAQKYLAKMPSNHFDGLFMSNVIEHMQVEEARELLAIAAKRLKPGARLAITTANPKCLGVMTDTFWNDMEHTRPYTLAMLCEILGDLGFKIEKAQADEDSRPQGMLRGLVRKARTALIGPYFEASEIFVTARLRTTR